MAADSGGFLNLASLWGKPLPKTLTAAAKQAAPKPGKKPKETRMLHDAEDDDFDADEAVDIETVDEIEPSDDDLLADVDAELEDDEETGAPVIEANADGDDDDDEPEEDEDAGEEADDSVEDDDVSSALEDDDEDDDEENTHEVESMSEKKKKSMSDHVRDEIAKRNASGDSLRGVDIVTALAKRGIKVSPAQVSQLLKKAGISSKARGPKKSKLAATAPAAEPAEERSRPAMSRRKTGEPPAPKGAKPRVAPKAATGSALPQMAQLKAAKAFVEACGGCYEEASQVLELHEQLHDAL